MVEKTFQKEFKRMTIDEILALDTEQLESMTVDELSRCVGKLLSDSNNRARATSSVISAY